MIDVFHISISITIIARMLKSNGASRKVGVQFQVLSATPVLSAGQEGGKAAITNYCRYSYPATPPLLRYSSLKVQGWPSDILRSEFQMRLRDPDHAGATLGNCLVSY
jgi:hypothetical protein